MITALVKLVIAARLATAIVVTWPEIEPERAASASIAIVLEHGDHEPALLAGIAYGESRFRWRLVNARGCAGAMQVCGRGRYATERASYAAGVRRLDESLAYCMRRAGAGNWTRPARDLCVLAGYASGPAGVRGEWYRQPRAVLARRDRLRAAMGQRSGWALAIGASS